MKNLETSNVFQAGKLLTLVTGRVKYGLSVSRVTEIIGMCPITTVPRTPDYLKGVINFRGKIIPALDLAKFLHPESDKSLGATSIVVVSSEDRSQERLIGLVVDEVLEVVPLLENSLRQAILSKASNSEETVLIKINIAGEDIIALDLNNMLESIGSA